MNCPLVISMAVSLRTSRNTAQRRRSRLVWLGLPPTVLKYKPGTAAGSPMSLTSESEANKKSFWLPLSPQIRTNDRVTFTKLNPNLWGVGGRGVRGKPLGKILRSSLRFLVRPATVAMQEMVSHLTPDPWADRNVCELLSGQHAEGVRKASWKHTPRGVSFQLAIDPFQPLP